MSVDDGPGRALSTVITALPLAVSLLTLAPRTAASHGSAPRPSDSALDDRQEDPGTVCIDEAHRNMHRAGGTYAALAARLEEAGFRVRPSGFRFRRDSLEGCTVLIAANALHERNYVRGGGEWSLPVPSAFDVSEVEAIRGWVEDGGALLLIADHMPLAGASRELASAFGVRFFDGFAVDTAAEGQAFGAHSGSGQLVFRRADGSLAEHPVTGVGSTTGPVDSVTTYMGQAFVAPADFQPLLVVPATTIVLLPRTAWEFPNGTPTLNAGSWLQGAAGRFGAGRVVMLGEAALFRPGEDGRLRGQNGRFAVHVVRWLASAVPESDGGASSRGSVAPPGN